MPKMKTNKTIAKRFKITSGGKLLRRHQLGSGHLRSNKSKTALERHARISEVSKGDSARYKKLMGE